ncbi:MAG: hypothetical protein JO316_10890 [Abitibacteriaceae bacterium]|nr:hypothetical protein [Abditibacteriaceae bacterium]
MKFSTRQFHKFSVGTLALAASLSLAGAVQAQPNPADANKGANPPNWPQGNNQNNQRGNFQNMTPEQRQQMIQQFQEQRTRRVLTAAGFTDAATQDPIVAFANAQEKARQPLLDRFQKLAQALRANAATDAELSASLNDLRQAVADEKTRNEKALKDLDAKVSYTKKPHLEALLTVLGIIGDESSFITGGMGRGMGGLGMGGMGRGMGGPGGGFGGGFGLGAGGAGGAGAQGNGGFGRRGGRGRRGGNGGNGGDTTPGNGGAAGNAQATAPATNA